VPGCCGATIFNGIVTVWFGAVLGIPDGDGAPNEPPLTLSTPYELIQMHEPVFRTCQLF
jgi:hypothetical protein